MIGYVYLTSNDINDVLYIGKRQKPKFEKWYKGSGTHLKLAMRKYGKEHFKTVILEQCETEEELCESEKKWISEYKANGAKLYNIAEGGKGGNMVDWANMPKEKRTEANRKNRESHLGTKNGFYGKHHTEETKRAIREKNSKRHAPRGLVEYKKRQREALPKIVQINKTSGEAIKVWDNWCAAGACMKPENRTSYAHIYECCMGKRKTAYGYKWQLEEGWQL